MVIHKEKMEKEARADLKGGVGEIKFTNMISVFQMENCRLLSQMTIPVNASIGEHIHINESEYYIIISGSGVAIDNGVKKSVMKGDLIKTGNNESHSIINNGDTPLEIIAIIITE